MLLRKLFTILTMALIVVSIQANFADGQQSIPAPTVDSKVDSTVTILEPVQQNPMEPSPLSRYVPQSAKAIHQIVPNGQFATPGGIVNAANHPETYTARNVDLSSTLAKYAAVRKCSINQAFADTVAHLKLAPIQERMSANGSAAVGYYKVVHGDTYQITAQNKFFKQLPDALVSLANGNQQIRFEIHFVSVPLEKVGSIRKFMLADSFKTFNNSFPVLEPIATHAMLPRNAELPTATSKPTGTFVSASETRTKVYPTFTGRFDSTRFKNLLTIFQADEKINIMHAPSMVAYAGISASVSDAAQHPFVVGINRVKGDHHSASKPVIQAIEDGTAVKLRATIDEKDGFLRLDGDLALSEVLSVETFGYPDAILNKPENVTVQIPEQKLKQVHWSTAIRDGNTIMIDPVFTTVIGRQEKSFLGAKKKFIREETRLLLFVTPKLVTAEK